jgi:hypothetical protein
VWHDLDILQGRPPLTIAVRGRISRLLVACIVIMSGGIGSCWSRILRLAPSNVSQHTLQFWLGGNLCPRGSSRNSRGSTVSPLRTLPQHNACMQRCLQSPNHTDASYKIRLYRKRRPGSSAGAHAVQPHSTFHNGCGPSMSDNVFQCSVPLRGMESVGAEGRDPPRRAIHATQPSLNRSCCEQCQGASEQVL